MCYPTHEHEEHEIRRLIMAIDNLNASIAALKTSVDQLIALEQGSVPQAQVDAAQAAVDAINTEVQAVVNPAPAPAKPAA